MSFKLYCAYVAFWTYGEGKMRESLPALNLSPVEMQLLEAAIFHWKFPISYESGSITKLEWRLYASRTMFSFVDDVMAREQPYVWQVFANGCIEVLIEESKTTGETVNLPLWVDRSYQVVPDLTRRLQDSLARLTK